MDGGIGTPDLVLSSIDLITGYVCAEIDWLLSLHHLSHS